jgi:hypothetical protein
VQHDTIDYSASEAVTWQIGFRYESVTYEDGKTAGAQKSEKTQQQTASNPNAQTFIKQAQDQVALNQKIAQDQIKAAETAVNLPSLNGLSFKEASAIANARANNAIGGRDRGTRGGV